MENLELLPPLVRLLNKNGQLFSHSMCVAKLACCVASALKYPEEEIRIVHYAAFLHDIGKLGMPAEIINKPNALSKDEFAIIQKHPEFGCSVLKQVLGKESVIAKVALQHHERLDGSGYPFGLRDKDIIPIARIVSVVDVIDTMVSAQVYRPALTMNEALREIGQNSGLRYDPGVVSVSLMLIEEGRLGA